MVKIFADSIFDLVGQTPLLKLSRIPGSDSAEVYVKLENLNPTGSVKARAALRMVAEAEKAGYLKRGSILVEASSGNQGIALAAVGAVKGYQAVIFMPESMSWERRKVLAAYGTKVVLTPDCGDIRKTIEKCIEMAKEYASETKNAYFTAQFENESNTLAHRETTAMEILEQTGGEIDAFVAGIGTGGTITGIGQVLKKQIENVQVIAVEPENASLLEDRFQGSHEQQGIGDGIWPDILDKDIIDKVILVSDDDAIAMARRLAGEEGIFAGISSGSMVYGAVSVANELGVGKKVVTLIADSGHRYLSTRLGNYFKTSNEPAR